MWTLSELARLGMAKMEPALLSRAARERIARLPAGGPRACHFAAFECRLNGSERVDVAFCLEGRKARAEVRRWLAHGADGLEPLGNSGSVGALLRAWGAASGPLAAVGSLWIELDVDEQGPLRPFVYFRPEHEGRFFQREQAALVRPLLEAWARASASALDRDGLALLERCVAGLPEGARVLLLAPELHAAQGAIRMSFRVSSDRLIPYLRRIGWPGHFAALEQQLAACRAQHWAMPIQLDIVHGQIAAQLSLEFTQTRENGYAEPCAPLLSAWVGQGICAQDMAGALLRWRYDANEPRPDETLAVEKLIDLKLTLDGTGSARAKAYLGTLGVNRYFERRAPTPRATEA